MSNPITLRVPTVGESVTEVEIGAWLKQEGEPVTKDENLVVLETDKATVEVPSPVTGRLLHIQRRKGERVQVGDVLGQVEAVAAGTATPPPAVPAAPASPAPTATAPGTAPATAPTPVGAAAGHVLPAAARLLAETGVPLAAVQPTGPGGRILKQDVQRAVAAGLTAASAAPTAAPGALPPSGETAPSAAAPAGDRAEEVVPMSLLRRKIAERLVAGQHTAALLTTFNEVDMSTVLALRKEHQERFQERYQIKLGFMSFFVKAVVEALKDIPALNAEIRGTSIVYRNYYDLGIAIGGGRGLVVPVLRHAERLSFAEVEQAIAEFARKAKANQLRPDDLVGGTFTLTNGGVYGSLLSTPLINPPQSGVFGMHAIQERPVAFQGQVVIRPMMYIALTYDHRLVDGREAVTFLRRVKELVENPVRMLVEI